MNDDYFITVDDVCDRVLRGKSAASEFSLPLEKSDPSSLLIEAQLINERMRDLMPVAQTPSVIQRQYSYDEFVETERAVMYGGCTEDNLHLSEGSDLLSTLSKGKSPCEMGLIDEIRGFKKKLGMTSCEIPGRDLASEIGLDNFGLDSILKDNHFHNGETDKSKGNHEVKFPCEENESLCIYSLANPQIQKLIREEANEKKVEAARRALLHRKAIAIASESAPHTGSKSPTKSVTLGVKDITEESTQKPYKELSPELMKELDKQKSLLHMINKRQNDVLKQNEQSSRVTLSKLEEERKRMTEHLDKVKMEISEAHSQLYDQRSALASSETKMRKISAAAVVEANNALRIERCRMEEERRQWRKERVIMAHQGKQFEMNLALRNEERSATRAAHVSKRALSMLDDVTQAKEQMLKERREHLQNIYRYQYHPNVTGLHPAVPYQGQIVIESPSAGHNAPKVRGAVAVCGAGGMVIKGGLKVDPREQTAEKSTSIIIKNEGEYHKTASNKDDNQPIYNRSIYEESKDNRVSTARIPIRKSPYLKSNHSGRVISQHPKSKPFGGKPRVPNESISTRRDCHTGTMTDNKIETPRLANEEIRDSERKWDDVESCKINEHLMGHQYISLPPHPGEIVLQASNAATVVSSQETAHVFAGNSSEDFKAIFPSNDATLQLLLEESKKRGEYIRAFYGALEDTTCFKNDDGSDTIMCTVVKRLVHDVVSESVWEVMGDRKERDLSLIDAAGEEKRKEVIMHVLQESLLDYLGICPASFREHLLHDIDMNVVWPGGHDTSIRPLYSSADKPHETVKAELLGTRQIFKSNGRYPNLTVVKGPKPVQDHKSPLGVSNADNIVAGEVLGLVRALLSNKMGPHIYSEGEHCIEKADIKDHFSVEILENFLDSDKDTDTNDSTKKSDHLNQQVVENKTTVGETGAYLNDDAKLILQENVRVTDKQGDVGITIDYNTVETQTCSYNGVVKQEDSGNINIDEPLGVYTDMPNLQKEGQRVQKEMPADSDGVAKHTPSDGVTITTSEVQPKKESMMNESLMGVRAEMELQLLHVVDMEDQRVDNDSIMSMEVDVSSSTSYTDSSSICRRNERMERGKNRNSSMKGKIRHKQREKKERKLKEPSSSPVVRHLVDYASGYFLEAAETRDRQVLVLGEYDELKLIFHHHVPRHKEPLIVQKEDCRVGAVSSYQTPQAAPVIISHLPDVDTKPADRPLETDKSLAEHAPVISTARDPVTRSIIAWFDALEVKDRAGLTAGKDFQKCNKTPESSLMISSTNESSYDSNGGHRFFLGGKFIPSNQKWKQFSTDDTQTTVTTYASGEQLFI